MKKLFMTTIVLAALPAVSGAKTLKCVVSDARWTALAIKIEDPTHVGFKILETNEAAKPETGLTAELSYLETVNPGGRVFFHYRGPFLNQKYQKTVSIYLSQDLKTLTRLMEGTPLNYSCQESPTR